MSPLLREDGEFSVVAFLKDGTHFYVKRWLDANTALEIVKRSTDLADVSRGPVVRIIITDGGDNTVFAWDLGEGVTFPTRWPP